MPQNRLLSESSSTFREMTFGKTEFSAGILISDIRYKHFKSQNNKPLYPFNGQLDYTLVHYFADSEIIRCNVNKFFTNVLMISITKNLSYCNTDKWIEKLSIITQRILDDK